MQAAQALTDAHYPARFLCYVTQSSLRFPLETISSSRDSICKGRTLEPCCSLTCNQLPVLYTNPCEKISPFHLRPVSPKLSIVNDNYLGTLLITFSA